MTARPSPSAAGSRMVELDREESLGLLAGVPMGRVGFTHQALPVIRPVNHLVSNGGDIVIRTHAGAALLASASASEVVVYEADEIDAATRTGWSVMVTGTASRVTEPQELSRFNAELSPWINTEMEHVVRIRAELVTGYRLLR